MMRRRVRLAQAAAALAALATALAIVDPHVGSAGTRAVLALDRSPSIDTTMRKVETRWLAAITPGSCVEPCRVVTFAARAQTVPANAGELAVEALLPPGAGATDLEGGLEAAIAAAPRGGRVVALSDGLETTGAASRATAAARARNVTIDAVPLDDTLVREAALTRLSAPKVVHQGDTISLLATVRSTTIATARLSVSHDGGRAASQVIQLQRGDNPYTLSYTATGLGWHSFRVRVELVRDQRPQDDLLSASVDVGPPPRALVVSAAADPPIARILAARGVRTVVARPETLPMVATGYAADDAVVLDDVPASSLATTQIAALASAVRDDGLGLLTLGGKHAYSLGGYAHSPLDRLLPVASLVPGDLQRRNLAIELVLDRSGSMSDTAGGVRKITMAQSAARQTARFVAAHRDELGIVAFDIVPRQLLSMQRVQPGASERRVLDRIASLQASGGTDIYLGLQAGYHQLLASRSPNRHLILLTDGISQPHNYTALLQKIARHHITVATIALGTNVDATLLRGIAAATGGNSYQTSNARDLPRIFVRETRLSAKPVQVTGRQQVVPQGSSPVVRSLAEKQLPGLTGNVVTHLRVGAQVDLLAKSGSATTDPALAQWGYGTGRVVSWTPGLGAPWAKAWESQAALWNDAVRFVARGVRAARASVTASEGVATLVQVDLAEARPAPETALAAVLERGRTRQRIVLHEDAPSLYSATIGALPPGSYGITLDLPAALGGARRVLVDLPYAAEYLPTPLGRPTLAQVAAQTGGRLLGASNPSAIAGDSRSLRVPLIVLALILYAISIGARMLGRRRASSRREARSRTMTGARDEPARETARRG
jgi:Ca-activated chloride channel family protein